MVDLRRFKIVLTVQTGPKLDPDVNRRPLWRGLPLHEARPRASAIYYSSSCLILTLGINPSRYVFNFRLDRCG
jgi:hypothetical protein